MPAPSADVLTATRAGTSVRHLLFYLDHPLGVVRAWDGIGKFVYNGDTYEGVGGAASIRGVSDSVEIQDHDVSVEVSGIQYSALKVDDGDIGGRTATVRAVLLNERGALVGTRLIFSGVGRRMRIRPDTDSLTLILELRGLLHNWSAAPRVYYSDVDQQRLFASDTGFSLMASLQDANVTGWSKNVESLGGYVQLKWHNIPIIQASASPTRTHAAISSAVVPRAIGNHTYGCNITRALSTTEIRDHAGNSYKSYQTGDQIYYPGDTTGNVLSSSESYDTPCYVGTDGTVRTQAGRLVVTNDNSAQYMRLAGAIASDGTATADTITFAVPTGSGGLTVARKTSGSLDVSGISWTALVFDNFDGRPITIGAGSQAASDYRVLVGTADNVNYVEAVTGTAALVSGANLLQVGGSNCFVSTTGVILSPSNRRIIRSGGDASTQFLRVWT